MSHSTDHKAEALRLIDCAVKHGKETGQKPDPALFFFDAVVHSNLAIAEGQERVAEELNGVKRHLVKLSSQLIEAKSEPDSSDTERGSQ